MTNLRRVFFCFSISLFPLVASAVVNPVTPLDISLEDLLNANVTTASRKEQRLKDVAAAIFVISREDIERSGATSIPEVLRMAPGIQVAKLSNNRWAVSARGFNGRFANKLLVLMDGRSIYSPLFSGVMWEAEDTLLEDIERIEVIRGPGAAMWGANAVNGVINIITRHARDTQGNLLVASAGTKERDSLAFRHGGEALGGHYRVWGRTNSRDNSIDMAGNTSIDGAHDKRIGFRSDWSFAAGDRFMLTGGAYSGATGDKWNTPSVTSPWGFVPMEMRQTTDGLHVLARRDWKHASGSESSLQAYIDNSELKIQDAIKQTRTTIDLDFQNRIHFGSRHDVVWGIGYRNSQDRINGWGIISVAPERDNFNLFSTFINDEVVLIPEKLKLMAGVRLEHNSYTGFEPQPNLRVLWTPTLSQAAWASASRASRTPSRGELNTQIDLLAQPGAPGVLYQYSPTAAGNYRVIAEKVTAFELGYRNQISKNLSFDAAVFHNQYNDLHSGGLGPQDFTFFPGYVIQTVIPNNNLKARSHGLELAIDYRPVSWWRLQPSYSYLNLKTTSLTTDQFDLINAALIDGRAPKHQLSLRSSMSLSSNTQFDLWLRHVSALNYADQTGAKIPAYTTLDMRYAWRPVRGLELSVVGQNLLHSKHTEFAPDLLPSVILQVHRGVYVKAKWQF